MSDSEVRPNIVESNRNKNVYNLSSALAVQLGLPPDVIEQALKKVIEQNSANSTNALPSSSTHNNIQELNPVDELSQSTALISPDSTRPPLDTDSKIHGTQQESSSQSFRKDRKDSLSSLIEITQSGSTSINIKLPSLHVPPPTVQGEIGEITKSPDVNTNSERQIDSTHDFSREYIPPQLRDSLTNHVQDTNKSFIPEVQNNRQIDSAFDAFKEYIPPQREPQYNYVQDTFDVPKESIQRQRDEDTYNSLRPEVQRRQIDSGFFEQQSNQVPDPYNRTFSQVISPTKKETYLSEYPSLLEAVNLKKNSGVDLGAWGQMDLNIASVWGKPKKWISETETDTFEPPTTSTWNPEDVNLTWKPMQEPKAPINKKKHQVNLEIEDTEGWGTPPAKFIPWDDSRQGYCVDLIEEQKETIFWSMQNGNWVNVSEEYSITSEKKTVEYTSDGVNHRNVRQTRTQTQRIERQGQGTRSIDDGATWDELREQTRRERRGLTNNATTDYITEDITTEFTGHSNNNNDSSEVENYQSNSDTIGSAPGVGSRERLGNPQWKSEKEWRNESQPTKKVEYDDLINLEHDISDPKGSEKEEPLNGPNKEISTWDNWGNISGELTGDNWGNISGEPTGDNWGNISGESTEAISGDNWGNISGESTEAIADIEQVKEDAWFAEDVQKQREDITREPKQNLLINFDSNNENISTESTIINTHPPIFYGRVNNEMADLNDILFDSTNPANTTANVDIELNLLSFDDEEDNKVSKSFDDAQSEIKNNSFNLEEFEVLLENNKTKSPEVIGDPNELQEKAPVLPYVINLCDNEKSDNSHYTTPLNSSIDPLNSSVTPRSYHCEGSSQSSSYSSYRRENSSQVNIESNTSSSAIDVNDKDNENKGSVNELQGAGSAEPNSNSTKSVTNSKDFIINLTVETPSDGRQILRLRYDDDPQIAATEFCRKWNMFHFEDALKGFVQKEQKRRLRKRRTKCKK